MILQSGSSSLVMIIREVHGRGGISSRVCGINSSLRKCHWWCSGLWREAEVLTNSGPLVGENAEV